jgi:mannose-6-phosphate isomerase-like protein (cupin superfamily)
VQYSCDLNIVRSFDKGKIELTNLGDDVTIGRAIFEPGWSWEKCVKPIAKTESCQAPHTMYVVSGRMKVVMDDGTEGETGPGYTAIIPAGHNAWVVGTDPCVAIDFTGAKDYAKTNA